MNRLLITLLLCTPLILFANIEETTDVMQIDSGLANFDGKKLTLTGSVVVEHELGTIYTSNMVLFPDPTEKKLRFGYLSMNENVKLALRDGSSLTCHSADLDYKAMTGKFKSKEDGDFVIFSENRKDRKNNPIPLEVKSRQMTMKLARDETKDAAASPEKTNKAPTSRITNILAQNDVTVSYNQEFTVKADLGEYQRLDEENPQENSVGTNIPGTIKLSMNESGKVCVVESKTGDNIKASQINIDTNKRLINFEAPVGCINASQAGDQQEKVEFAADSLIWDNVRDTLILKGNVRVDQKGIGRLITDKELRIYHANVKGKKQLKAIESTGQTILTHTDEQKELNHTLISSGKVYVDHEKLETLMESPLDENGKVLEGKQVFFHDFMGEIQADKLKITYKLVGHEIVPTKLILQGNVRLLDRKAEHPDEEAPILHYALADSVEYDPETKEMSFKSLKKKRVLFYDRVNNLQISAPAMKIKRDGSTKKESIQGFGDVRMSFVESEFEQLRKRFTLDLEEEKK